MATTLTRVWGRGVRVGALARLAEAESVLRTSLATNVSGQPGVDLRDATLVEGQVSILVG
jgi:hypothetical protein